MEIRRTGKGKGREIFEDIIIKNSVSLMRNINQHIKKAQKASSKINSEIYLRTPSSYETKKPRQFLKMARE